MNSEIKFETLLEEHTRADIERYDDLKKDIADLKIAVESLIATWNQAKGVITFVKWIVGISGSVGAFILFVKDHVK